MFHTDFMPRSNHATLQKREAILNGIGVDLAFRETLGMVDSVVLSGECALPKRVGVRDKFVTDNQFHVFADMLVYGLFQSFARDIGNYHHSEPAIAFRQSHNGGFVVLVPGVSFAMIDSANPSFIYFDSAAQLASGLIPGQHRLTNTVAKIPRRLVAPDAKQPHDLKRGDALLGFTDKVGCEKPFGQGQVRIIKNRASRYAELVVALLATKHFRSTTNPICAIRFIALRAYRAVWPAQVFQVGAALVVIVELLKHVGKVGFDMGHSTTPKKKRLKLQKDSTVIAKLFPPPIVRELNSIVRQANSGLAVRSKVSR
jgi:hypothetical protein